MMRFSLASVMSVVDPKATSISARITACCRAVRSAHSCYSFMARDAVISVFIISVAVVMTCVWREAISRPKQKVIWTIVCLAFIAEVV